MTEHVSVTTFDCFPEEIAPVILSLSLLLQLSISLRYVPSRQVLVL